MTTSAAPPNPNRPHPLNPLVDDLYICRGGDPHAWSYRREVQEYFCLRCKGTVSKFVMKKSTDQLE